MLQIYNDYDLTTHNTFALDATTPYWAEFNTTEELREILLTCGERSLPWYVLGCGSNIILTGNFPGVIIHPTATGITLLEPNLVRVEAGVVWDDFVAWCVDQGLGGVENLSFIPGSVGAAPIQNVGAYGVEVKNTIQWVEYFDTKTLSVVKIPTAECEFGYRDSVFKKSLRGRAIVTAVVFRLTNEGYTGKGGCRYNIGYGDLHSFVTELGDTNLHNIRTAVIAIREAKLPDPKVAGNAGSFFKNPVIPRAQVEALRADYPDMPGYDCAGEMMKVPAAWLIDRAGWKGYNAGTVGVHPKQALVIVNLGGATAQEILTLAGRIIDDVQQKFGIALTMEVNVL